MPTLPDPQRLDRVRVQPNSSVASYSGAEAPALALAGIGADIRKMAEYEQNQLDDLRVNEAITKLRQKEIDLTVGEQGYANVKGSAVLSRPIAKEYGLQHDQVSAGLVGSLTGRQRARFEQAAAQSKTQFQSGVMRHSLVETDKAHMEVYTNSINVLKDGLSKQANDPLAVNRYLGDIRSLTEGQLARQGYDPKDPKAKSVVDVMVKAAVGSGHAAVIESYIQNDQLAAAETYLRANEEGMTPDQIKTVTNRLKPLSDNALGTDMGIQAFTQLKEGKSAVDVALWVANKAKGNPQAASAANAELNRLQSADKIEDEQKRGTYLLRLMQNPSAGTASTIRKDVLKDPTLDPGQKAAVLKTVEDLQHTEQSRQREDIRWWRSNKSWNDQQSANSAEQKSNKVETFMKFAEIRYSPDFASKTPEQLASYTDIIGPTLTKQLLDSNGALKNKATSAAAEFQIDKDLLGEAIPEGVLKDKNKLMAFRGIVETNLQEWKQQHPGKIPSLDEQRKLAVSARKDWVEIGTMWNSTSPQYEVKPGDKAVPKDFYEGVKAAAQKRGQKVSDDQVLQMWRSKQPQAK